MHELAVCNGLLAEVARVAAEQNATAVTRIELAIGRLSGVEPALLERAFGVARAGTIAAGAELVIHEVPVRVRCPACDLISDAEPNRLVCGSCGDWKVRVTEGTDLLLERVHLDLGAEPSARPVPTVRRRAGGRRHV